MELKYKKKKSPSKTLRVVINNKEIKGEKATEVFVNAIKKMGPNKIVELTNYTVDKLPLIVPKRDSRKQMNPLGKYGFVCTHLSTLGKKSILKGIAKSLKIAIEIEVLETNDNQLKQE